MKKALLPVMLILAVFLLSGCGGPTESKPEEFTIVDGVVTGYTGKASEIVIPDGVTAIGKEAFKNANINSVVIPDSCTQIDTDLRPTEIILDCTRETVVLNGASWAEYQPWEKN